MCSRKMQQKKIMTIIYNMREHWTWVNVNIAYSPLTEVTRVKC